MSFSKDMERFAKKAEEAAGKIVRTATLDMFVGVVRDTPVDTGRARGNWQLTINEPAQGELDREDKGGNAAIADIVAKTPEGYGQETMLTNNLPYIEGLEYGRSKQAPNGMVRRNLARVAIIVRKAAAKFRV